MPDIESLCDAVDGDRLFGHLEEFARRVKLSGTPEELESFRYLQAELDGSGYRTELVLHDAYISLPGAARLEAGPERPACITHSFSRPSGPDGVRGVMVAVGAGTEADFAAADVRGRIVLVDGLATPAAALRASRAGAIGQIHVSAHEHRHEMCISSVWGSPTPETLDRLPSTVALTVAKADGERLKARAAGGEADAVLFAEVDTGWRKTPLLVADLDGADADAPFVMFSGHHDTWYYGVMDNGGANATMLEVARLLAPHRERWRRGLRLCFWSGHSHGRYAGSTWYADTHWGELERRCAVHVNVDSTGARGNTVLSDMLSASELRGLAAEAVRARGGQELAGFRMSRAGDQSFWGVGVPSMFMGAGEQPAGAGTDVAAAVLGGSGGRKGAGFGWWWHTPEDTLDKMDRDLLVRDTRIYVHTLWRLLTAPVPPLDYAASADALAAELGALGAAADRGLDLSRLVAATGTLRERAAAVTEAAADAGDAARARRLEGALMRASRHLVPLDYTTGDRFGHDPALGQAPFPVLDPIRALAKAAPDSDAARFALVAATRARNRVAHALDEATAALEAALA